MADPRHVSTEDYVAIQRLLARASDAVTRRDLDQFESCWAEDGVWTIGLTRGSLAGRATIIENLESILGGLEAIIQTVGNGDAWYVDGGTDTAEARFYITELIRRKTGENTLLRFFYADRLVRLGGGWQFTERTLNPLYVGPYDLSGPFESSSCSYADL